MKIGIFTDPHYSSAPCTEGKRFNNQSLRKIREAVAYFQARGCDKMILLGDVTDTEPTRAQEEANARAIAAVLDASGLDTVCLMGNHDGFVFTEEEFYGLLGQQYRPRDIHQGSTHLLFVDACHYRSGLHYHPDASHDWTDTYYPYVEALAQKLATLQEDVYLFMHQNIDPEIPANHRLANDAALEQSQKVRAVYQGHYHRGHCARVNGIAYVTFAAMCENEGAYHILKLP